jgi:hypothetical protein
MTLLFYIIVYFETKKGKNWEYIEFKTDSLIEID